MSTSIESPPSPTFRGASQSSQFEERKKELWDGEVEVVLFEVEELDEGEECRAEGMAQKEWRLDCWVD
jgi:hypothetical protein